LGGSVTISNEFFNKIASTTHADSISKCPFVLVVLRHLERRERHITVRAHDGDRQPREIFNFPTRDIKPIVPPVAPLVQSTRDYFHNFRRSLPSPRCEGARSKLCNLISYFLILPVQTIILGEDFHKRLTVVRRNRPNILRQGNHDIRCQLVELHDKPPQNLHYEMMRREAKAGKENASNTTNSPSGSRISSAPGARPTPSLKYPSCCISCTRTEEIHDVPNSTVWPSCNSVTIKSLRVSSNDEPTDNALTADEEEDIATYHRRRCAVCFTRARFPK
jgi:hypothetical protein